MPKPIVWIFLILSGVFALTHLFAMQTELYWYYLGFDSVMHVWGGILITLGVHAFCTFTRIRLKPTLVLVLCTLLFFVFAWEIFEYLFNIHNKTNYLFDTIKDIVLGLGGGLITHFALMQRTIKHNE